MLNTYINDNMLSAYPFVSQFVPPFPFSVFSGFSVCVHGTQAYSHVVVTGVEITAETVTATITLDGSIYAGRLTARHGKAVSMVYKAETFTVHAVMSIGIVPDACHGTYAIQGMLDPSCVVSMPDNCLGFYDEVKVNGISYDPGECLGFLFDRYLNADMGAPGADGYRVVDVEGYVPEGAVLTVAAGVTNYKMVESVNGQAVTLQEGYDNTLEIDVAPPDGSAQGTDSATYVKMSVDNAIMSDDVDKDPDGADPDASAQPGERSVYWCNLNDLLGDAVILTITGTSKIPSCYGSDDEAGEDT